MYDALVAVVVGVGEEDVPVLRQRVRVDGKTVILAGDEAAICSLVYAGLVVTTIPVPERQEEENGNVRDPLGLQLISIYTQFD